jgi:uncharacterized protein YdhG (YjbR/CyaY superfamily)
METKIKFTSVDQYMDNLSAPARQQLELIRKTLHDAAPGAKELIHYQMPALEFNGKVFIYFAAFKDHYHITLPKAGKVFEAFKDEFSSLDISKSTIRLPKNKPVPLNLLKRIAAFRVNELSNA